MGIGQAETVRSVISEPLIERRVKELAREIEEQYQDTDLVAVCVLKGSFVFFSDLVRRIDLPMSCEFLGVSSYGQQRSKSGEVKITLDLATPVVGRHLLLVEDLIDTGATTYFLMQALAARRPASIKVCSLLVRRHALRFPLEIDYAGFEVGDEFIVGYGIDSAERYRGLSYIGALEKQL